jgi:hypothetical protein
VTELTGSMGNTLFPTRRRWSLWETAFCAVFQGAVGAF